MDDSAIKFPGSVTLVHVESNAVQPSYKRFGCVETCYIAGAQASRTWGRAPIARELSTRINSAPLKHSSLAILLKLI